MVEKFDYAESQADALELIEEFGESATLERKGEQTGLPHDPEFDPDIEYACIAVSIDNDIRHIEVGLIRVTDLTILVAAFDARPTEADRFIWKDESLQIINVKTIEGPNVVVYHQIQCRV